MNGCLRTVRNDDEDCSGLGGCAKDDDGASQGQGRGVVVEEGEQCEFRKTREVGRSVAREV